MWDEITKDAEYMDQITSALGDRKDIWQDRFVWAIAKTLKDTIILLFRLKKQISNLEKEVLYGKYSN